MCGRGERKSRTSWIASVIAYWSHLCTRLLSWWRRNVSGSDEENPAVEIPSEGRGRYGNRNTRPPRTRHLVRRYDEEIMDVGTSAASLHRRQISNSINYAKVKLKKPPSLCRKKADPYPSSYRVKKLIRDKANLKTPEEIEMQEFQNIFPGVGLVLNHGNTWERNYARHVSRSKYGTSNGILKHTIEKKNYDPSLRSLMSYNVDFAPSHYVRHYHSPDLINCQREQEENDDPTPGPSTSASACAAGQSPSASTSAGQSPSSSTRSSPRRLAYANGK